MSSLRIDTHKQSDVFFALQDEWEPLVRRSHADRIFSTWEWNWHWWRVYQPGELHIVTVRDNDGQLLCIAPWFIEKVGEQRLLATIGCDEVSDYLDLIIARGAERAVLATLTEYLRAGIDADQLYICNMPADSPAQQIWPAMLGAAGFETHREQQEICPRIILPDSWEAYLSNLNKKQRHELRRKIRRLEGATDQLDWYTVTDAAKLDRELPLFLQLMAESDPAKARFLENNANHDFFQSIARAAAERGWLRLSFLTIAGRHTAAYLNFQYGDELLVYNSGLSASANYALSPGIVLLAYLIQDAIASGLRILDFLRGDEIYKFRMGGVGAPIYKLLAKLPLRQPCQALGG